MAQSYVENARKLKEVMESNQKIVDTVELAGGIRTETVQSDKIGYDWSNIYVNDILVRQEYVEQENPAGTSDNPIEWVEGMTLITNAFYTHEGVRKVWCGETGQTATWDDSNWEVM